MTRFLIFMSNLTFLIFSNFRRFFIKHLRQKRHLLNMFSRKCQVQNDRINWEKISCFCQKLDLTLYFTIKTSIFKLRPLFRFLCLINSFYRRYVSCIPSAMGIECIHLGARGMVTGHVERVKIIPIGFDLRPFSH